MTKPRTKKKAAPPADKKMTTAEIAAEWQMPESWFIRARTFGFGPPFIIIPPGTVRYDREGAKAWLAARTHYRTSDHVGKTGTKRIGRPPKNTLANVAAKILTEA
jgi:hypothetical protein